MCSETTLHVLLNPRFTLSLLRTKYYFLVSGREVLFVCFLARQVGGRGVGGVGISFSGKPAPVFSGVIKMGIIFIGNPLEEC